MGNQNIFRQLSDYTRLAETFGIDIEYGSDFEFFCNIPKIQPLRHFVSPAYNPEHSELDSTNALWMVGRDRNGEIVHTQAIKLLALNDMSLDRFFSRHLWELRPGGYHYDHSKTSWHLTPSSSDITGKVSYHGELWMKGGPDGFRGGCLTILLTRLMLLKALANWSPNYMIGFQSPMTSCRGLGVREGYMRTEQRSILWYQHSSPDPMEDWLVWMNRQDAIFNLRLPAQFFYDLLEKPAQEKVAQYAVKKSA